MLVDIWAIAPLLVVAVLLWAKAVPLLAEAVLLPAEMVAPLDEAAPLENEVPEMG